MTLSTASYRLWTPDAGIPVRTSAGAPRIPPAPLVEWETVYPPWALVRGRLDHDTYRRRYRHMLHQLTPKVLAELQDLRDGYDASLCLLCHCDLLRDGAWCHRRFLAGWITQHTGEDIPEVASRSKP